MNWGYKAIPQEYCNGRRVDLSRGKGLGGSSAINFSNYTIGPRDDYDQWASLVGDDSFQWTRMQPRFKNLETFTGAIADPQNAKKANPWPSDHGTNGALHVGYIAEWDQDMPLIMDAFEAAGIPPNPDNNSGDPIGRSLFVSSSRQGARVTAADLLLDAPDNLTIAIEAPVQSVILQGNRAVGVVSNGKPCMYCGQLMLRRAIS